MLWYVKKKYDFNYLNESEINNNLCTLENLEKLPYLNRNQSEIYKLFLASRPDLGDTVQQHYLNIINQIENKEKILIDDALKKFKDASEYNN